MPEIKETTYLKDLWSDEEALKHAGDPLALLRYRSNLLGADLRITNFGGGNTSSKIDLPDPFTGPQRESLWRLNYATRAGIRLRPVT